MRLKHNRICGFLAFPRSVEKDREGGTYESYGAPESFCGIAWPAGGSVQQAMYGANMPYVYNVKVDGSYTVERDGNRLQYTLENGTVLHELDGISLHEDADSPEYQITAVMGYEHLQLEVMRIDRRTGKP